MTARTSWQERYWPRPRCSPGVGAEFRRLLARRRIISASVTTLEIAVAAAEFITGPLLDDPRRVGKPLGAELAGIYSARLGRDWRVLCEIDDAKRVVIVLDIRHRSAAYRRR